MREKGAWEGLRSLRVALNRLRTGQENYRYNVLDALTGVERVLNELSIEWPRSLAGYSGEQTRYQEALAAIAKSIVPDAVECEPEVIAKAVCNAWATLKRRRQSKPALPKPMTLRERIRKDMKIISTKHSLPDTAVIAELAIGGRSFWARGYAHCSPDDRFSSYTGAVLAARRCVLALEQAISNPNAANVDTGFDRTGTYYVKWEWYEKGKKH